MKVVYKHSQKCDSADVCYDALPHTADLRCDWKCHSTKDQNVYLYFQRKI